MKDGYLEKKSYIPVTAIACAKPQETTASLVGRITDQLQDLGRRYRDEWRHPDCDEGDAEQKYIRPLPTLYGFVIKSCVVAIITCDASIPGKPVRTMLTTDWTIVGQDVWNAIAIALAFIRQRNFLMQLDEEGLLPSDVEEEDDDIDA